MKRYAENDPAYYALKSVAVQCQGFYAAAPVVKDKGVTWLWLTDEHQKHVLRVVPRDLRWQFDDRRLSVIATRYPRHFFGYADGHCSRQVVGLSGMEDALVDAAALHAALMAIRDKLEPTIGFRSVFALLEMALGRPLTSGNVDFKPEEARAGGD